MCRGELLATLHQLDEEEDINKVLKYFSYEHFYVIYCKVRRCTASNGPPAAAVEQLVCMSDAIKSLLCWLQFWELDTDHDFYINKEDLLRYGNHSLTYRIVDRIFSQVCSVV